MNSPPSFFWAWTLVGYLSPCSHLCLLQMMVSRSKEGGHTSGHLGQGWDSWWLQVSMLKGDKRRIWQTSPKYLGTWVLGYSNQGKGVFGRCKGHHSQEIIPENIQPAYHFLLINVIDVRSGYLRISAEAPHFSSLQLQSSFAGRCGDLSPISDPPRL